MGEIHQYWLRNSSKRLMFKNFNKSNLLNLGLKTHRKGWPFGFGLSAVSFNLLGGQVGGGLFSGACFAVTPQGFSPKFPFLD